MCLAKHTQLPETVQKQTRATLILHKSKLNNPSLIRIFITVFNTSKNNLLRERRAIIQNIKKKSHLSHEHEYLNSTIGLCFYIFYKDVDHFFRQK